MAGMSTGPELLVEARYAERPTCATEGHIRPWVEWYSRQQGNQHSCSRCGAVVEPQIDWDGHP